MEKHHATMTHKAELNNLMESNVTSLTGSAVDEQAFAVLNMQVSQGMLVASSPSSIQDITEFSLNQHL
jgi:hypothetical protein